MEIPMNHHFLDQTPGVSRSKALHRPKLCPQLLGQSEPPRWSFGSELPELPELGVQAMPGEAGAGLGITHGKPYRKMVV